MRTIQGIENAIRNLPDDELVSLRAWFAEFDAAAWDRWVMWRGSNGSFSFVLSAYRDRSRMDASTLRRWLIESEGWPCELADQLALEYEYGRELLSFAEEHRRSA